MKVLPLKNFLICLFIFVKINIMNNPTVDSVLNHPFAVSSALTNKNRLINYLNQHGYNQRYGRNLYYQNFTRELPHIAEFLDNLQQEEELTNWLKNVEVEQTTQRPHDERQEQYDMMNWMQTVEVEEPTQRPHSERVQYAIGEDINTHHMIIGAIGTNSSLRYSLVPPAPIIDHHQHPLQ